MCDQCRLQLTCCLWCSLHKANQRTCSCYCITGSSQCIFLPHKFPIQCLLPLFKTPKKEPCYLSIGPYHSKLA